VPTLAVAGKYTVDGDQEKMLVTSDQLIVMEQAANKKLGNKFSAMRRSRSKTKKQRAQALHFPT